MEMTYQRQHHFEVPDKYLDLFNKITDPRVFSQDLWYKMPDDEFNREFTRWYIKVWGCAEMSETGTHFRVTFWPFLRKPGVDLTQKDIAEKNGSYVDTDKSPVPVKVEEPDDLDGL